MKRLISIVILLAILVTSCACPASIIPSTDAGSLEQRLDLLVEQLEQQRQTLHIPGMAIAVVMDDEVILTRGFGVSNIETETPVTPETILPIGSSTKAFTSTLVGMLVDEGKMDWDDPITEYLPYFKLNIDSDDVNAEVTLRDVLSHRTGFTRMGLLFGSGKIPREEILQDATAAEPWVGFREKFYYSNVVYMSGGVAAGEAAGSDWDTLIAERIFQPLGMESSSTSINQVEDDPYLSLGYLWEEDLESYKHKPLRNVDNIGPSGSINSNVIDMAEWIRLQLGRGEYEGNRLISEEQLEETWTSHIDIAEGVGYGLGWMLREWEGQLVVEHGGNVDGFSAQVALLPESDLGFVLLTNASVSSLPAISINMVWEALLGEWQEEGSGDASEDYQDYLGVYVANFGSFTDSEWTVLIQNDRLAIDVPGQQVYELKEPDEEGKWNFAISDEIAVSFERDESNNVVSMKLYQAGFVFELPKEGIEITPEIPLEELQRYLGSYYSEELELTITVLIQNNRLAIDWPGEMIYELYPPDEEGIWAFRISDIFTLRFNETLGGQIESLTYYQDNNEYLFTLQESEPLPTVEEIMNLRDTDSRVEALEMMGDYQVTGTIHSVQSGVKGTFTAHISGTDQYRVNSDYGKYGSSQAAVNGDQACVESSFAPFEQLHGILLEQAIMEHPAVMDGNWLDYYDSIEVLRSDRFDEQDAYVLQLKHSDLPPTTLFIDADNGNILKSVAVAIQEGGIGIQITTVYEDYREVDGIFIAFRYIASNEQSGSTVTQVESIETNLDINDDLFILTTP